MRAARLSRALLAATLTLASGAFASGPAVESPPLPEADQQCLGCHGQEGLSKTFDKGDPLGLHVDVAAFAGSVHAPLGCAACHAGIDPKSHPGTPRKFESARAYAIAGVEICRNCHAPIFEAFSKSVHGRNTSGAAPICADCHSAHRVARASVGTHLRENCVSCHPGTLESHEKWLPNTKRHLESVACAACHAPGVGKRLDLRLYSVAARGEPGGAPAAEANGEPLDGKGLRDFLEAVNRGAAGKVTLVGRLEAGTAEETHSLAPKDKALRDCATCHRKGADPFQNVTLSIIGPDGKRVRYEARSDVLHASESIDSMRRFYAPGGTRIQALDVLLGLALAGGITAPLGHLIVRKLSRRKDKQ